MATVKTSASTTTDKKDNDEKKILYFCPVCPSKKLLHANNEKRHTSGITHQESLKKQKKDFIIIEKEIPYFCPLCPNKKIYSKNSEKHNSGALHQKNLRNTEEVLVDLSKYFCPVCPSKKLIHANNEKQHTSGITHQESLKKLKTEEGLKSTKC